MKAQLTRAPQGSEEWLVERIPYVTASDVAKVMAGGNGITRHNYMVKKLCEILSGKPLPGYKSKHMQDGNDREQSARDLYSLITDTPVSILGFAYLPDERLGASTDGLVEDNGLWECKNVIAPEQVSFIDSGKIKPEYIKQMQTQMYVLEKEWCDFQSTCFGDDEYGYLPEKYQVKIQRVYRDEDMILTIRKEVAFFWHDLDKLLAKFREKSSEPTTSNPR